MDVARRGSWGRIDPNDDIDGFLCTEDFTLVPCCLRVSTLWISAWALFRGSDIVTVRVEYAGPFFTGRAVIVTEIDLAGCAESP